MNTATVNKALSGQVLVKSLLCLMALALMFGALIYPAMEEVDMLDARIAEEQAVIARQTLFFPLFARMKQGMDGSNIEALPQPITGELSLARIPEVPAILGDLARAHGLEVKSVVPDPGSLDQKGGILGAHCVFKGEFSNARRFLLTLGVVEYVEHIAMVNLAHSGQLVTLSLDLDLKLTIKAEGQGA